MSNYDDGFKRAQRMYDNQEQPLEDVDDGPEPYGISPGPGRCCPDSEVKDGKCAACGHTEALGDLRILRRYIGDEPQHLALLDLQLHVAEFNSRFHSRMSLTMPKRSRRQSSVIGKATDNNHLLYQDLLDGILANCPRPLTVGAITQRLVDMGEKPSTARMVSPAYYSMIVRVLDPSTKLHRGAEQSLLSTGGL